MRCNTEKAIARLQKALDDVDDVKLEGRLSSRWTGWHRDAQVAIEHIFGAESRQWIDFCTMNYDIERGRLVPVGARDAAFERAMEQARVILQSIIEDAREYWVEDSVDETARDGDHGRLSRLQLSTSDVFIVHGHDEALRESTARLIERLGLSPIILQEKASKSRTIIEKLEQEGSAAGYAICLLTPDDVGHRRNAPDEAAPRARQNAVLELGYFMGKLGRERVCALYRAGVELPSDYLGVVYISADESDWKFRLVRELKAAGYDVDANQAL